MSWLLNLLGLAWKSELDEYRKDCIALEAENMRLGQDVYRLEMNLKSSDAQVKVLRSDNAMLREHRRAIQSGKRQLFPEQLPE